MRSARIIRGAGLIVLAVTARLGAADWPQWRGPDRNGIAPESPPLASAWPKEGPARLWSVDGVPSDERGNLSSPVIAEGRVFLYVNWWYKEPITTRTLPEGGLRQLGWFPEKLPDDLRDKVETARCSEERAGLSGKELNEWVEAWIKEHLTDEQKNLIPLVRDRLRRGQGALPFDVLEKLAAIRNKEFPTQEAIEAWLAENGFEDDLKDLVMRHVPTTRDLANDVILCLDLQTGSEIWKVQFEGQPVGWGASSTPCVKDGRVYVLCSRKIVYCLDVKTGDVLWQAEVPEGHGVSSSFLLAEGAAVILARPLTALSVEKGEQIWMRKEVNGDNPSPVLWRAGDRSIVLCNTAKDIGAVDLKGGEVLWTAPGGGSSSVSLADQTMLVFSQRGDVGLTAYQLSPEKAEKLWKIDIADRGASPIIWEGHVYAVGGGGNARAVCVDLASGQVAWDEKVGNIEISSPILADGKLIVPLDGWNSLGMIAASPEKYELLAKAHLPLARCTSPAFSDGKLVLRLRNGIACYDLRASPQ